MSDLCWCGSGKAYAECPQMNDQKIALLQKQGMEVPSRDMIKTPEQIAGIRAACKINTAVLDEVAKHIKAGMTTAEIDRIVYDSPLLMVQRLRRWVTRASPRAYVRRLTTRFATVFRANATCCAAAIL